MTSQLESVIRHNLTLMSATGQYQEEQVAAWTTELEHFDRLDGGLDGGLDMFKLQKAWAKARKTTPSR